MCFAVCNPVEVKYDVGNPEMRIIPNTRLILTFYFALY